MWLNFSLNVSCLCVKCGCLLSCLRSQKVEPSLWVGSEPDAPLRAAQENIESLRLSEGFHDGEGSSPVRPMCGSSSDTAADNKQRALAPCAQQLQRACTRLQLGCSEQTRPPGGRLMSAVKVRFLSTLMFVANKLMTELHFVLRTIKREGKKKKSDFSI